MQGPNGAVVDVPGYRIVRRIGHGGFAIVYEAEQLSLGRAVALKMLKSEVSTEKDLRRFERERLLLSELSRHRHVVDVIDAGTTADAQPFIVMRLYRRGSLAQAVADSGPMRPADVVQIVGKLAGALQAAHNLGVVHRDVKPENVLIADDGEPALADFGISVLVGPDRTTTGNYFTMGHVAPEVLQRGEYGVASDVYALASTAYTLLAGHLAFSKENQFAQMRAIVEDPVPPIGRRDVPAALEAVVARGMAKHPADRYASTVGLADAMADALKPPGSAAWAPAARSGSVPYRAAPPADPETRPITTPMTAPAPAPVTGDPWRPAPPPDPRPPAPSAAAPDRYPVPAAPFPAAADPYPAPPAPFPAAPDLYPAAPDPYPAPAARDLSSPWPPPSPDRYPPGPEWPPDPAPWPPEGAGWAPEAPVWPPDGAPGPRTPPAGGGPGSGWPGGGEPLDRTSPDDPAEAAEAARQAGLVRRVVVVTALLLAIPLLVGATYLLGVPPGSGLRAQTVAAAPVPAVVIASDLSLQGYPGGVNPSNSALELYLERIDHRAGQHRVTLRPYDIATPRWTRWDDATCQKVARQHVARTDEIAVIGPYNSGCAKIMVPILNGAGGGPIAMVSNGSTDPGLTKRWGPGEPEKYYPSGRRNFARVVTTDDVQGRAAATFAASDLRVKKVFVLNDGATYGKHVARAFSDAAKAAGIVVVAEEQWNRSARDYRALFAKVKASGADAVFLGGAVANNGARLVQDKVAVLGGNEDVRLLAADGFTGEPKLVALPAAQGMYLTFPGLSPASIRQRGGAGSEFLDAFQKKYGKDPEDPYALYCVAAAQVLTAAVQQSDGTRAGVVRALFSAPGVTVPRAESVLGADTRIDPVTGDVSIKDVTVEIVKRNAETFETVVTVP